MTDALSRRDVLDDGYVELLDFMGDESAVVDAARVSFDKRAAMFTDEQNDRLLRYLDEHDHGTPYEMVSFKFRVRAPVVVYWQWTRHRIASYNFISGRYVPFEETDVYRPTEWRGQSKTNKQGSEGLVDEAEASFYSAARDSLYEQAFRLYREMIERGVAREQARLVLPFAAVYYDAIVCMNARSLRNFLKLRTDGHAQSEIRQYALAIQEIVRETHPRLFR